jgi:hypothetical protein
MCWSAAATVCRGAVAGGDRSVCEHRRTTSSCLAPSRVAIAPVQLGGRAGPAHLSAGAACICACDRPFRDNRALDDGGARRRLHWHVCSAPPSPRSRGEMLAALEDDAPRRPLRHRRVRCELGQAFSRLWAQFQHPSTQLHAVPQGHPSADLASSSPRPGNGVQRARANLLVTCESQTGRGRELSAGTRCAQPAPPCRPCRQPAPWSRWSVGAFARPAHNPPSTANSSQ